MRSILLAILLVFPSAAIADPASSVASADYTCALFDATGLASEPCRVDGFGSAVVVSIDMEAGEARQTCAQVSQIVRDKGHLFDAGWTLQIRSPYSGSKSIAYCEL